MGDAFLRDYDGIDGAGGGIGGVVDGGGDGSGGGSGSCGGGDSDGGRSKLMCEISDRFDDSACR